jgi:peptidoglycan hydrolase CwlO-like protein
VGDHEKMINTLEARNKVLEEEKRVVDERSKAQLEYLHTTSQQEIENLTFQCGKLRTDLNELSSFSVQKDDMSLQLKQTKAFLEKKEQEYRETIHVLERKILQDKVSFIFDLFISNENL